MSPGIADLEARIGTLGMRLIDASADVAESAGGAWLDAHPEVAVIAFTGSRALVSRQPFGGFRLSGTGNKAGGPDYLRQFMDPVCIMENTARRGFAPEVKGS